MINGLFDRTVTVLQNTLDLRALRHKLIASNIANQETPGYKATDINFEREIKRLGSDSYATGLATTDKAHKISSAGRKASPKIVDRPGDVEGYDHNTVGTDAEMARLSENSLMYTIAAKMLRSKFTTLMSAIKEGGR
ncbi:MAG: flagellar basal body rod protein FlgB [Deltaproteobacteria bacterium]